MDDGEGTRRWAAFFRDQAARSAARAILYSRELVELIFFAPYCRIADAVNAGVAKRQTASEH